MKDTNLKKKITEPPMQEERYLIMKKKMTLSKAKKKANIAFSKYIRTRDMLKNNSYGTDTLICITCEKPYPAFRVGCAQCGHFIPGRHSAVLYDERNAHGQCYNCNINLKGNWVKYEEFMLKTYGQAVIDELKELDKTNPHLKANHYLEIEEKYKRKLEEETDK